MKTDSIQDVAKKYNMTLTRAAEEILCAAGVKKRFLPTGIRKQYISPILLFKAKKIREFEAKGLYNK